MMNIQQLVNMSEKKRNSYLNKLKKSDLIELLNIEIQKQEVKTIDNMTKEELEKYLNPSDNDCPF